MYTIVNYLPLFYHLVSFPGVLSGAVDSLHILGSIGRARVSDPISGVLLMGHPDFLQTLLTRPIPVMGADLTIDSMPMPVAETSQYRLVFMHRSNLPHGFGRR